MKLIHSSKVSKHNFSLMKFKSISVKLKMKNLIKLKFEEINKLLLNNTHHLQCFNSVSR